MALPDLTIMPRSRAVVRWQYRSMRSPNILAKRSVKLIGR
jgi:hypothetical protein